MEISKWEFHPLGKLLEVNQSGTWGEAGNSEDYPVLRSTNIQDNHLVLKDIAFRKIKNPEKYTLKDGDLIVSKSSGSQHLIGKCCIFKTPNDEKEYLFSNFTQRLRVNQKILNEFLYFFLISPQGRLNLKRMSETTSGLRNLNMKDYFKQSIPTPPKNIQTKIVKILKTGDKLRRKRKQTEKLLNELSQSVFLKMFGEPDSNPKNLKFKKLSEIMIEAQYGTSSPLDKKEGVPCLRMSNITEEGRLDLSDLKYLNDASQIEKFLLKKGDVLFNRTNSRELVGKTALFDEDDDYTFAGYLVRLIPDKNICNPYFLSTYMNLKPIKKRIRRMAIGSVNQANINARKIQNLEIYLPPIKHQNKFQDIWNKILDYYQKMKIVNSYETLQSSLLYRAFDGKLV